MSFSPRYKRLLPDPSTVPVTTQIVYAVVHVDKDAVKAVNSQIAIDVLAVFTSKYEAERFSLGRTSVVIHETTLDPVQTLRKNF